MKTELLNKVIEAAKSNKKVLKLLKNASVHAQQYEFAASLREFEKSNFPESEECIEAKKKVGELDTLFRMIGLNVPDQDIYKIYASLEVYRKKKGKFDLADAAKIIAKGEEYFDE